MDGYAYQPLCQSTREIRLLKLLPTGSDCRHRHIPACHIFHTSLLESPRFVALSYVWGDTKDVRILLLEKQRVKVTKNLYDAIMALRPLSEPLVIWIDSLCINQSDDEEKSRQVRLMADIYRRAHKVIAWLGTASDESDSVMDYLNWLGAKVEGVGMDLPPEGYREVWQELVWEAPAVADIGRYPIPPRGRASSTKMPAWDHLLLTMNGWYDLFYTISGWYGQDRLLPVAGMQRLFTRPWFGRIWVLQEFTVSENAEFLCGRKSLTRIRCRPILNAYTGLWLVIMAKFHKEPKSLAPYHLKILEVGVFHRANVMVSSHRVYKAGGLPLAALLRATCMSFIRPARPRAHHLESTDPRDKIFALLGIAADREELKALGVSPNYTKSCQEIYTATMAALLQQGHISLLPFCQSPKILSELPSWVPDWSRGVTEMLQDVGNDSITLSPTFSASGVPSQHANVDIIRKDGVIHGILVACYIYDKIQQAGSVSRRVSSPSDGQLLWPISWLLEFLRLTYNSSTRYRAFKDRLSAASRASIGDVGFEQAARLVRVGNDRLIDALYILQMAMDDIGDIRIKAGLRQLLANKAIRIMMNNRAGETIRLRSETMAKSLGRLPFITEKGHLVLSYDHVQRGDVVALIPGAQVPFILRRQSEGRYQVIGEAYVDGIMDGEAMDVARCSGVELV